MPDTPPRGGAPRLRRTAAVVGALALALALTGCATSLTLDVDDDPTVVGTTPTATPDADGFPVGAALDYQLGGAYDPPAGTGIVARDSTEQPAPGTWDVCYVNGFQTQPGVEWPDELLVHRASGELLVDPGWPDEHLFDLASATTRDAVADRMRATVQACADDGFDAVEFDNLDSYTRSDGAFGLDDAVAFATLLVGQAHDAGLLAGQKNTAELEARGRDEIGYDFAVVEECDRYDECPAYTDVYGERVLAIEYVDDLRDTVAGLCSRSSTPRSTVVRDRDLVTPDDPGYSFARC
ncbi:glycosyl hydrolase family 114 [Frigoribacterium sp. PhB160]|uniref:endo alpha-1,4 polygalactosaminidase n=1 Tax=Frigoribacterium sp. PhB160 TaxID=2485192 RepID=UPI000F4AD958|nr:endo alpha-1,4 polygalactosaminidase [Frigoribacterium sp. PhB160]ROS61039.1 glycosyl hydrolase family 114 [Frigoribacterium sp. PhB160]